MIDDDGYRALRDAIVSGELLPSERLVEEDLSRRLGIGRAAVRMALVRLVLDEAVVLEAHERHPDRRAPEAEPAGEVLLDQALAGQQLARDDRVAQGPVSVVVDQSVTQVVDQIVNKTEIGRASCRERV